MKKEDIPFWTVATICLILFIVGVVVLEIRVQRRWDEYELKHRNDIHYEYWEE